MTTIKIKRVYEEMTAEDGYRIFVDKLWPRGMKKENLHYDLWAKEVSPSAALRSWFHQDSSQRWTSFVASYTKELEESPAMATLVDSLAQQERVTLLYASKDALHNHALVLQTYLEQALSNS